MRQHLRAHCVRPTTILVMSVSFILLSLQLRGTQVQPDLFSSMTSTRKVPIKQSKVFKGMPVLIILVIITLMTLCEALTRAYTVYLKLTLFLLQVQQSSLHLQRCYYFCLLEE
jgi:hypothetical protein